MPDMACGGPIRSIPHAHGPIGPINIKCPWTDACGGPIGPIDTTCPWTDRTDRYHLTMDRSDPSIPLTDRYHMPVVQSGPSVWHDIASGGSIGPIEVTCFLIDRTDRCHVPIDRSIPHARGPIGPVGITWLTWPAEDWRPGQVTLHPCPRHS